MNYVLTISDIENGNLLEINFGRIKQFRADSQLVHANGSIWAINNIFTWFLLG